MVPVRHVADYVHQFAQAGFTCQLIPWTRRLVCLYVETGRANADTLQQLIDSLKTDDRF